MANPTLAALRYARGWAQERSADRADIVIEGGPDPIRAHRYVPSGRPGPHPGWVVLHGVTRPGPDHPSLVRFANALASAGGLVVVPEIPAWRALDLDPDPAQDIVRHTTHALSRDPGCLPAGVVVVGFSFGCPQAILAAEGTEAPPRICGAVGFGGYRNLTDTVRFGLTGEYTWAGVSHHLRPDPYGRWVVACNYLHRIPGLEGAEEVSDALRTLASLAGDRRIMSWDPSYDGVKDDLAGSISTGHRPLFRFFAPPADREPDRERAAELAPLLAEAARATHPRLDLEGSLTGRPLPPVHLIHGHGDHLIPHTETLSLRALLEGRTTVRATITSLFAHSTSAGRMSLGDGVRFLSALRGIMALHRSERRRP